MEGQYEIVLNEASHKLAPGEALHAIRGSVHARDLALFANRQTEWTLKIAFVLLLIAMAAYMAVIASRP